MPIVYRFPHDVIVEVWPDERHLRTTFGDGTCVPAQPHDNAAYLSTAIGCGYETSDPCWDLCRDHELAHTWLAHALRDEHSLTLWLIAHGATRVALSHPAVGREERDVLAYQTRLNGRRWQAPAWHQYRTA